MKIEVAGVFLSSYFLKYNFVLVMNISKLYCVTVDFDFLTATCKNFIFLRRGGGGWRWGEGGTNIPLAFAWQNESKIIEL